MFMALRHRRRAITVIRRAYGLAPGGLTIPNASQVSELP